ncbi:MAG: ArsI/CadI family heavy metal resistance metalloenzyme [Casimicrobiaceae bacterium]
MKRFHVHVGVNDLDQSIRFYSNLFGAEPAVRKGDYAKWMLDDPRVNFAISRRGNAPGVNHLGLQVESDDELDAVRGRFAAADSSTIVDEPNVSCCYAKSNKHWVTDPQGIAWEAFHSLGTVSMFEGEDAQSASSSACCSTAEATATSCCAPASAPSASACCVSSTRAATPCC